QTGGRGGRGVDPRALHSGRAGSGAGPLGQRPQGPRPKGEPTAGRPGPRGGPGSVAESLAGGDGTTGRKGPGGTGGLERCRGPTAVNPFPSGFLPAPDATAGKRGGGAPQGPRPEPGGPVD